MQHQQIEVKLPPFLERVCFAIPVEHWVLCQVRLSNGIRAFLIEDHEVPLVKASLAMKGGQRASPADKVGFKFLSHPTSSVASCDADFIPHLMQRF